MCVKGEENVDAEVTVCAEQNTVTLRCLTPVLSNTNFCIPQTGKKNK